LSALEVKERLSESSGIQLTVGLNGGRAGGTDAALRKMLFRTRLSRNRNNFDKRWNPAAEDLPVGNGLAVKFNDKKAMSTGIRSLAARVAMSEAWPVRKCDQVSASLKKGNTA
jgi:hypothetical protein